MRPVRKATSVDGPGKLALPVSIAPSLVYVRIAIAHRMLASFMGRQPTADAIGSDAVLLRRQCDSLVR